MLPFPRMIQYGNTTERVPVFQLVNFNTVQDIKDTSTNNITVNNTGITVGTDARGTYMNFNGSTGNFLSFSNSVLTMADNYEIEIVLSSFTFRSNLYPNAIFDNRPAGTNGNYIYLYYSSNEQPPYKFGLAFPSGTVQIVSSTTALANDLITIRLRSTGGIMSMYVNNILQGTVTTHPFVGTNCKIGQNAFVGTATVPYLQCRMYSFKIFRLVV